MLGQHHRRERVALGSTEELLRLGEAPLPAAQIREPHDGQAAPGRPLRGAGTRSPR